MTLMEPWRWVMWSSDRDYIWRWPTHLMVPCMDDDDPFVTLMMWLDDMVEPLLVIGPVDAHGDGSCDVV